VRHEDHLPPVEERRQYCTFRLGELAIGIEVTCVQEVIRHDEMTEVPLAPPDVRGLINLRGQIVTVLDIRNQLGLSVEEHLGMNVVIRNGDEAISILVNEANDVVSPAPEDFEPLPAAVSERVRTLVSGAFKLDGRLLLILDRDKVLTRSAPSVPGQTLRRSA